MKITKYNIILLFFTAIFLFHADLFAEDIEYSLLSSGYVDESVPSQNLTINSKDSFNVLLKQLNVNPDSFNVDFNNEVVALIVPDNSSYPDQIKIDNIKKSKSGGFSVEFILDKVPYVPGSETKTSKPYTLLKFGPIDTKNPQVSFKNADPKGSLFVNQSLGDAVKYTNVMSQSTNEMFIKYLPLDKGNSWTYEYESGENKGMQTFSIVSYTQDWSIFDSFFGKNNLAMKIDPHGNLFISSSNKGIRPFYTQDVLINYQKEPFTVKAGTFEDVLVITSPPDSPFQFKDVYAEGIGLIYHEHTSLKGSAKYSLAIGNVRGRKIP